VVVGGMLKIVFFVMARNARPVLTDTMWLAYHPSIKNEISEWVGKNLGCFYMWFLVCHVGKFWWWYKGVWRKCSQTLRIAF